MRSYVGPAKKRKYELQVKALKIFLKLTEAGKTRAVTNIYFIHALRTSQKTQTTCIRKKKVLLFYTVTSMNFVKNSMESANGVRKTESLCQNMRYVQ